MEERKPDSNAKPKSAPAPHAPDALSASERERRAARESRAGGRPLRPEETAPGERGDGPYGDSEPGRPDEPSGV
jgi:hypothetical protein